MQDIAVTQVKNPHGLIVPDVRITRRGVSYHEDRVDVVRSLRDDPLGRLHDRNQISESDYRAGREWQRLYELAELGRLRAQDPTIEPVDGSRRIIEPITDKQMAAKDRLGELDFVLGGFGAALVRDVLGDGLNMRDVALRHGFVATSRQVDYLGRRLREVLKTLAKQFGYA